MSNTAPTQNLPTTPDWSKAPDLAKWFAIDSDGKGWYYNKSPMLEPDFWASNNAIWTFAGNFDGSGWATSLQQRPKIEGVKPAGVWIDEVEHLVKFNGIPREINTKLNSHFNTDISDYLAGKYSFITGLVDLLLLRMAKEERFSESEYFSSEVIEVNDVIVFESEYDNRTCYALADAIINSTVWTGRVVECIEGEWCHRRGKIFDLDEVSIRPINELEAVTYRRAMEAVYG